MVPGEPVNREKHEVLEINGRVWLYVPRSIIQKQLEIWKGEQFRFHLKGSGAFILASVSEEAASSC